MVDLCKMNWTLDKSNSAAHVTRFSADTIGTILGDSEIIPGDSEIGIY